MRLWKHNPTGKWMSAVLRRHCIVRATDALSRVRTPGTRSTGTIKGKDTSYNVYWSGNDRHCWFRSICGRRMDRENFLGAESLR